MVKKYKIILIWHIILLVGCGGTATSIHDEILKKYNMGIEFYNKEKYSKAKDSFEYVILHSAGSKLALESEFYLAESFYHLKDYESSIYRHDGYVRSSQDLKLIELSRFRICECAYNLTADYKHDQSNTNDALEKIDFFLEDYPNSEFYNKAFSLKEDLRQRLAKKDYESARLYMKLSEYPSAIIYLNNLLDNYSDTSMADDARIAIIFAYILDGKYDLAMSFYETYKNNFSNQDKKEEALSLLKSTEDGVKMTEYIRLFR